VHPDPDGKAVACAAPPQPEAGLPALHAPVRRTAAGTAYLQSAGVIIIAAPRTDLAGMAPFLEGFGPDLGFTEYLRDPDPLAPGALLCKAAGQICYASLGPRRTRNAAADRYFRNILDQGHGSVLEHASYSLLLYGVSRSMTMELIRHRHLSFSQVSQRYVGADILRFVERPEFQPDDELHRAFEARIDRCRSEYAALIESLRQDGPSAQAGGPIPRRTEQRKAVQQAARALLPNETEAPLVVSGNARAWRQVIALRTAPHAEPEIRAAMVRIWRVLAAAEPLLFGDFTLEEAPDGVPSLSTPHPKV
jgi:thymidylate synthase (FAD)